MFKQNSLQIQHDLDKFISEQSEKNENFRFRTQFLNQHDIVVDLIRADREGLWDLYLDAIQRALYEFTAWGSTNYIRYGSIYLEEARNLEETAPGIYEHFSRGSFSIKDRPGKYIAVGGDKKLEMTVNKSSKASDSVIGHSKQKQFVAKWAMNYHEMHSVNNLYREYAGVTDNTSEAYVHRQASTSHTARNEAHV